MVFQKVQCKVALTSSGGGGDKWVNLGLAGLTGLEMDWK